MADPSTADSAASSAASTASSAQVTFAGVADKALDKISDGLGNLVTDAEKFASTVISRIDQIAPQMAAELRKVSLYAWECMIRQKRAEGAFYILGAIMVPCIFWIWYKYFIVPRLWASKDETAQGWGWAFCVVFGLATTVLTPLFLYWGITYLISPEYYAVLDLIEKIHGTK
ncbi:hypothetical protein M0R72_00560 [Candidatus Pacearchaeota archaeon]|jgi:hypothetical protein|nr:hypothetical protein [Candidatus Pacearchaeota archaeon]